MNIGRISAEVKNGWCYTCIPPTCLRGLHMANFTFYHFTVVQRPSNLWEWKNSLWCFANWMNVTTSFNFLTSRLSCIQRKISNENLYVLQWCVSVFDLATTILFRMS